MPPSYVIANVAQMLGSALAVSRFSKDIAAEHRDYFGGEDCFRFADQRTACAPHIGTGIQEPRLAETWARFDTAYRADARLSRFWATELEDAVVFPPFGIVAVGNVVIRDTVRMPAHLRSVFPGASVEACRAALDAATKQISAEAHRAHHRIEGTSFLLGIGTFENYFNWTLRYASRVALYQTQSQARQLLVPPLTKAYIADTLEFLGVPQHECRMLNGPVICERLVLVSPMALGRYELSPLMTRTLRDHPRITALWRQGKRPLYIPRRNVSMRSVVNEEEVEAALAARGFLVFDNAAHTIHQQARVFRNASMVVAPHGAGLSNIVYCDPGTPVIEIVPEGYDQGVTSYRSLSDLFGLRYRQMFGREVTVDRKGNRCNSDIAIDVKDVVSLVEASQAEAARAAA